MEKTQVTKKTRPKKETTRKEKPPEFLDPLLLPKPYQKILAIGFENEDIPRVYCPTQPHFKNIPPPTCIDDFLAENSPDNQTFHQWRKLISTANYSTNGNIIYLLSVGDFNTIKNAPDIEAIKEYILAFYTPMKVICLDAVDMNLKNNVYCIQQKNKDGKITNEEQLNMRRCHPYYVEKMDENHKQFAVGGLLRFLSTIKPADAACLIAITMEDLYEGAKDEFVVGMAGSNQVGIFSFCRYLPNFPNLQKKLSNSEKIIFLSRCCKVAVHEIGHDFGIMHCSYYACCMNGSGNLIEDFSQPIHLCPIDLRKVITYTKGDPIERYEMLMNFYAKYKMEEERQWVSERLKWINQTNDSIENGKEKEITNKRTTRQSSLNANQHIIDLTKDEELASKKRKNSKDNQVIESKKTKK